MVIQREKQKTGSHKRRKPYGRQLLMKCFLTALCGILIWNFLCEIHRMSGNNMYPSLRDGDLCFLVKQGPIITGDIVYYETPSGCRFGRVCAVGGQEVRVEAEGGYLVNGYAPVEKITYPTYPAENGISYPCNIPDDGYFLFNDFREDTTDSRELGAVNREQIHGKVLFLMRRRDF